MDPHNRPPLSGRNVADLPSEAQRRYLERGLTQPGGGKLPCSIATVAKSRRGRWNPAWPTAGRRPGCTIRSSRTAGLPAWPEAGYRVLGERTAARHRGGARHGSHGKKPLKRSARRGRRVEGGCRPLQVGFAARNSIPPFFPTRSGNSRPMSTRCKQPLRRWGAVMISRQYDGDATHRRATGGGGVGEWGEDFSATQVRAGSARRQYRGVGGPPPARRFPSSPPLWSRSPISTTKAPLARWKARSARP